MAKSDPKVKAKAEALAGKKAKLVAIEKLPEGTKPKKLTGPVLDTLEEHLGIKLKKVRLHTGGDIEEIVKPMKVRAITDGWDIYFAKKAFAANPEFVTHEIVHAVQQAGGKLPKPKAGKVLIAKK